MYTTYVNYSHIYVSEPLINVNNVAIVYFSSAFFLCLYNELLIVLLLLLLLFI